MIGAIIGDIVGSRFEFNNHRSTVFELFHPSCKFTDDTVCTIAVADWILQSEKSGRDVDFAPILQSWCKKYPDESYGSSFRQWISTPKPYNSFGNGAAMRISPVGDYYQSEEELFEKSDFVTGVSHNHPEGIKGARATALCIWLGQCGASKEEIKETIENEFGYNLDFTCDQIRPTYQFNETCQETVPQSIVAFLDSTDFESAIRLAVSIGGDSDTIACITGGISEAFYQYIPQEIINKAINLLPEEMKLIVGEFYDLQDC